MLEKFINQIIHGDCVSVIKQMSDNSIDLIVTSPPYNLGIKYDVYNDNRNWNEYYQWCREWLKELYRISKDDGRMCLVHYLSCGTSEKREAPLMKLNCIAEEIGFKHHGLAVWNDITLTKQTAWGSWKSVSAPYINSPFEGILIMYKNHWKKEKTGKSFISTDEFIEACSGIWNFCPERDRCFHPASFPVTLAKRCINLLSYEDDIVLDPFIGIGTTAIASKELNRKFIGIEISENYCIKARKLLSQGSLF